MRHPQPHRVKSTQSNSVRHRFRVLSRREASGGTATCPNLPEHTSKLEETYEAEGGQVSRHPQQQLRVVQRDAHPLEARLEHGTCQLRLLLNEQRFYLQKERR